MWKVLWVSSPDYTEQAIIRGKQLDGPNTLGVEGPLPELDFPLQTGVTSDGTASGWRDLPSTTYVPAPGCYAYQVDGINFSYVLVFQAALASA